MYLIRIYNHLNTEGSAIFKHLKANPLCNEKSNNESFSIIDSANDEYKLDVKERLHIEFPKLLNIQNPKPELLYDK